MQTCAACITQPLYTDVFGISNERYDHMRIDNLYHDVVVTISFEVLPCYSGMTVSDIVVGMHA